jgi:hypothetical protein
VALLESRALGLTGLISASTDDWDRYASGSWRTAYEWAAANLDHEYLPEISRRVDGFRGEYLRFRRQYIGWAIFVACPASGRSLDHLRHSR